MAFKPTEEQELAVEMFLSKRDTVVEAGAGTGKTSTLKLMAEAAPDRRGQYSAFNKAIVMDSKDKFPSSVKCNTAHSLAWWGIGKNFSDRLNSSGRIKSHEIARRLRIEDIDIIVADEARKIPGPFMAGHIMQAVTNFCQSADLEPSVRHFSYIPGIDEHTEDGKRGYTNNNIVQGYMLDYLVKAWQDLTLFDGQGGQLPFKHEHYLKIWQTNNPVIDADYILFDEAQDASPVMLDIVLRQKNAQKILVGDSQQSIYAWIGAINALQTTGIENKVFLSQSFRFGPAIADMANKVLTVLGAELRLRGLESIDSRLDFVDRPDCYLTRTNAAAVRRLLIELGQGQQPHLMGGGKDVMSFAEGAQKLKMGMRSEHPDLACFASWTEVQEYVNHDPQGDELRLLVKLVDDFGPFEIIQAIRGMSSEDRASIVISTAHKAKGREWHSVELGDDFPTPKEGEGLPGAEELRLLYVAITRASHVLDIESCKLAQVIADRTDETDEMSDETSFVDDEMLIESEPIVITSTNGSVADVASFEQALEASSFKQLFFGF